MDSVKTMKLSAFLLVASAALAHGQRPSFAGSRPIGYPEMAAAAVTEAALGDRFGEVDGTTQRLPIEANGDKALVDRLSKLPIDKQPFWFINWQALEAHRQNPQTYPQKPNPFIDPQFNNVDNVNTGNSNPNGGASSRGSPNLGVAGNPNLAGSGNPNLINTGMSSFGFSGNPNPNLANRNPSLSSSGNQNIGNNRNTNLGGSANKNLGNNGNPNLGGGGSQNFGNNGIPNLTGSGSHINGNNQNTNLGGSSGQNLEDAIMAAFGNANTNLGENGNPNIGNSGNPNLAGSGNQNVGSDRIPNRGNTGNFDLTDRFSSPSNLNTGNPNLGVPGNSNFGNSGGANGVVGNPNRGTNGISNLGNLNTGSSFGNSNVRVPATSNAVNTGNSNRGTVGNSNAGLLSSGSTLVNANQANRNPEPNSGSASIEDRFHGGIELNNFPVEYENVRTNLNSGTVNSKPGDIKTIDNFKITYWR